MEDDIILMSEALATKGKVIEFKHNSVYSALELSSMAEVSSLIATAVKNDVNIIRNEMMPIAKSIVTKVEKLLSDNKLESELSKYKITENSLPEILTYLKDENYLRPVTDIMLPIASVVIPEPKGLVKDAVKFDNAALNAFLKPMLTTREDSDILNIWNMYLSNISDRNDNISRLGVTAYNNLEDIIILFAMVDALKAERPEGVTASEGVYQEVIEALYTKISNVLVSNIEKHDLAIQTQSLIVRVRENELVINAEIYDKFLENNTSEVLLGLLLSGEAKEFMSPDAIVGDADRYKTIWDNAVKRDQFKRASQEVSRYKIAYDIALTEVIREIPETLVNELTVTLATSRPMLEALLQKTTGDDILALEKTATSIVGNIIFIRSNFNVFTGYMTRYFNINASLKPEEAATMAIVDMVLDYLTEQFVIVGN